LSARFALLANHVCPHFHHCWGHTLVLSPPSQFWSTSRRSVKKSVRKRAPTPPSRVSKRIRQQEQSPRMAAETVGRGGNAQSGRHRRAQIGSDEALSQAALREAQDLRLGSWVGSILRDADEVPHGANHPRWDGKRKHQHLELSASGMTVRLPPMLSGQPLHSLAALVSVQAHLCLQLFCSFEPVSLGLL
jgi:hypothetical protein